MELASKIQQKYMNIIPFLFLIFLRNSRLLALKLKKKRAKLFMNKANVLCGEKLNRFITAVKYCTAMYLISVRITCVAMLVKNTIKKPTYVHFLNPLRLKPA